MYKALVIPVLLALCFTAGPLYASSCVIPPGTYQHLLTIEDQSYYFNDKITIFDFRDSRLIKIGNFSVRIGEGTLQRTGNQFTGTSSNGVYTRIDKGLIYFSPSRLFAEAAARARPGVSFQAPEGIYTKKSDGRITFVPARSRPNLKIEESNCNDKIKNLPMSPAIRRQ